MIPDPRTLPVLSKGVLRRGVQISLGNIISTREQVGKLSTHLVETAYLIVILTPESLSYRCSRFPPNKMLLLGSTEPTGCIKICQMLASAFSQSRCGETNGSPFFLFSSGYFSTDFLSNQTSTKKTE